MKLIMQYFMEGKGIHSTTPFNGILLKDLLIKYFPVNRQSLKSGLLCIAGKDGYRSAVSYSELFNRNDQQEFMLIKTAVQEDGGLYRIFAASDFFSDRAINQSVIYTLVLLNKLKTMKAKLLILSFCLCLISSGYANSQTPETSKSSASAMKASVPDKG